MVLSSMPQHCRLYFASIPLALHACYFKMEYACRIRRGPLPFIIQEIRLTFPRRRNVHEISISRVEKCRARGERERLQPYKMRRFIYFLARNLHLSTRPRYCDTFGIIKINCEMQLFYVMHEKKKIYIDIYISTLNAQDAFL